MKKENLSILRCPVTREVLTLKVIESAIVSYSNKDEKIISQGILTGKSGWIYPVIDGIPRMIVEAFLDYDVFFAKHLKDYSQKKMYLLQEYGDLVKYIVTKNKRTKESFKQEWNLYNYEEDKTWDEAPEGMLKRFFIETDESVTSIKGKIIFDAGCGNGLLDSLIANCGATVVAMDFSESIIPAFKRNKQENAFFIQGDVQFPPVAFQYFDIVHCSGVLIHTNNPELSFSKLVPCIKPIGKFSVWLYHPRENLIHNTFNKVRRVTSKLPLKLQFYLYSLTLLPMSFIVKKLKGNKQNPREMMIDLLDWLSPEFRWELTHEEVTAWYMKYGFHSIKVTTTNLFGFNIIGVKDSQPLANTTGRQL
ncbi:MAG: methyltransferase protein [Flaviaesturariibacter sp.]|nr:methyltransferase protein [Flaviaesturariibacter sp.]